MVGSGPRWEFVGLATCIGTSEGVTWAVSCLCGHDAVRALHEVHEVRLDVACTTIALAVQTNGNDACEDAVVVCLLNGRFVIGLLGWVSVLGSFI